MYQGRLVVGILELHLYVIIEQILQSVKTFIFQTKVTLKQ